MILNAKIEPIQPKELHDFQIQMTLLVSYLFASVRPDFETVFPVGLAYIFRILDSS